MKNIIGDWKTVAILTFDEKTNQPIYAERAHFEPIEEKDIEYQFDCITRFCEDGTVLSLLPLPEGITEEMVLADGGEMFEGMLLLEKRENAWKEEEGKLWMDSGEYREVLGEVLSSFDELVFEGDTLVLTMCKLERI